MFEPLTDAAVVALLEELEQTYGTGGMVPLTDLKLDHFYEYQNVNLNKGNNPLRQFARQRAPWFAMLAVENPNHNWNLEEPDPTIIIIILKTKKNHVKCHQLIRGIIIIQ